MASTITYRDREAGRIVAERVYPEWLLRYLYEDALGRLVRFLVLQRRWPSRIYGWFKRRPRSIRGVRSFAEALGIDLDEAELPATAYRTFEDFFTRRLAPGARPIDPDPAALVSPADGCVLAFPRVPESGFTVKRSSVTLPALVGDAALAARFVDGAALVIRLRPVDYHRFHFPASGDAAEAYGLGALLHSVHPIALAAGADSFRNKRCVTRLSTETFGEIAIIEIGALAVGSVVQTFSPGQVTRGQEKGYFSIGGSAMVMLVEAGRFTFDDDLVASTRHDVETFVKVGTRIGLASRMGG